MDSLLEILKYSLPSLLALLATWYLFKSFLNHQFKIESLKIHQNQKNDAFPIKLQAYERLMMFCERISIDQLSYRLLHAEMGVNEFKNAMIAAIQQEYEHNLTQQLYVSKELWQIIKIAKDQMQNHILQSEANTTVELINNIKQEWMSQKIDSLNYAKTAIKDEAALLM